MNEWNPQMQRVKASWRGKISSLKVASSEALYREVREVESSDICRLPGDVWMNECVDE